MTTRRDVLRIGAGAVVGAVAAGVLGSRTVGAAKQTRPAIRMGVQLYSVREQLKGDFVGVITQLGKMGFEGVEFAGYYAWDKKPGELKKILDDNGLMVCGTHTPLVTLQGEALMRTVEFHQVLGTKYLIVPSLGAKTAGEWASLGRQFAVIDQKLKPFGMKTGFHAHAGEFKSYEGKTAWEIFFDAAGPEVVHQIDVGNTFNGHGDAVAMIRRYPGQTKSLHMKEAGGGPEAVIGEGKVDWAGIIKACEEVGGTEWFVVEHETSKDPLKAVERSLAGLRGMMKG